ncbi:Coproporphyrinogen 3 oxidase [Gracilaria domingensis]|nr:Coproporphyrinogen 3 oxidase [Gracilaria domingensis]
MERANNLARSHEIPLPSSLCEKARSQMTGIEFFFIAPFTFAKIRTTGSAKKRVVKASISESSEFKAFCTLVRNSQERLCETLESVDGSSKFSSDEWKSERGGGLTRVLQNGLVFEKAGVNVSVVKGTLSVARAEALRKRRKPASPGEPYSAAALSFVLHAQSPHVPTLRGDVRMFSTNEGFSVGGGVDLTVFYVNREQIMTYHQHWKAVCDLYDAKLYYKLKKQCDEYFFIPSRAEYRGAGGLFYDDLELPRCQYIPFTTTMLKNFLPSYLPILQDNVALPFTAVQKRWQRIRRGRYLEFNLLNDRGVRFGLAGAHHSRTDSIMISAPPSVEWPYRYEVQSNSPEWKTLEFLQGEPIDWVSVAGGKHPTS